MRAIHVIVLLFLPIIALPQQPGKVVTLQLPNPCASVTQITTPSVKRPELIIYPNPTNGLLTLALPGDNILFPAIIKVYTPTSVLLHFFSWDGSGPVTIDCSIWPAGIYLLEVSGTNQKIVQRIITY